MLCCNFSFPVATWGTADKNNFSHISQYKLQLNGWRDTSNLNHGLYQIFLFFLSRSFLIFVANKTLGRKILLSHWIPYMAPENFSRPHLKNKQLRRAGEDDSQVFTAGTACEECRLTFPKFNYHSQLSLWFQTLQRLRAAIAIRQAQTGTRVRPRFLWQRQHLDARLAQANPQAGRTFDKGVRRPSEVMNPACLICSGRTLIAKTGTSRCGQLAPGEKSFLQAPWESQEAVEGHTLSPVNTSSLRSLPHKNNKIKTPQMFRQPAVLLPHRSYQDATLWPSLAMKRRNFIGLWYVAWVTSPPAAKCSDVTMKRNYFFFKAPGWMTYKSWFYF